MAWNEPGNNGNQNPWGNNNKRPGGGPPDLDDMLREFNRKLGGLFGGGKNNSGGGFGSLVMLLVIAAVVWAAFGFYTVKERERAVVLRFGDYHTTQGPGLHWRPFFVDDIEKVDVETIATQSIRGTMLTKEENIVDVSLDVQYRIAEPRDYLFNITDPDLTIKQAAESALRETIGDNRMDDIITKGRGEVRSQTREKLEAIIDEYGTGIVIAELTIREAKAPGKVQEAFDDAIKAREDQQKEKNKAEAYARKVVPEAEGRARRVQEAAQAYKEQIIARAEGDVAGFLRLLPQIEAAPEVTRKRLYLETLEEVLGKSNKVIVDVEKGNNMMYVPLDQMLKKRQTNPQTNQ